MSRARRVWPLAVLPLAGLLAIPVPGSAAPQTSDQQRCINDMNKYGTKVAKSQNKADASCVQNAARGLAFRLGVPPQAQTAQACLTNDVGGKIAKDTAKLQDREVRSCLESPEQLPGFGYTSATAVDAAARAAGLGIVAGLFGPDLDAAIVPNAGDSNGARCQSDVLKYTSDLFYTMWKEALTAKKNVLKGTGRLTGTGPIGSTAELQGELVAIIQADARGKIAKAATKLHDRATLRCTGTLTPLEQMFPGGCAGSATPAALGVCAEGVARGQFFQSLGAADALSIDCDLADDGL